MPSAFEKSLDFTLDHCNPGMAPTEERRRDDVHHDCRMSLSPIMHKPGINYHTNIATTTNFTNPPSLYFPPPPPFLGGAMADSFEFASPTAASTASRIRA